MKCQLTLDSLLCVLRSCDLGGSDVRMIFRTLIILITVVLLVINLGVGPGPIGDGWRWHHMAALFPPYALEKSLRDLPSISVGEGRNCFTYQPGTRWSLECDSMQSREETRRWKQIRSW